MDVEKNKALVRRYFEEGWNKGDLAVVDQVQRSDQERAFLKHVRAEWPDIQFTIDDQVAEGDKVVTRLTVRCTHTQAVTSMYGSIAPTNKEVTFSGITINRIEGDTIAENWSNYDYLGLYLQVGAIPQPSK